MPTIDKRTDDILRSLRAAITAPALLPGAIAALQELVWHNNHWETGLSAAAVETLGDLAYDLEYYVADPIARAEDPSYFGEERAIEEINNALARIDGSQSAG